MTKIALGRLAVADLVQQFAELTVAQDEADLGGQYARYKRLYARMMEICEELKSRDGDQRRQLLELYSHPNMHVRLQAAKLSLAVVPVEARAQLQAIVDSKWYPQAGDAGMCLLRLESGEFKPT